MMKRYLLVTGCMAGSVFLVVAVLAVLPMRPGVTKANFDRIEKGMTRSQVEAIFGGPSSGFVEIRDIDGPGAEVWHNDNVNSSAGVLFANDKVDVKYWFELPSETTFEKCRRWLRLPWW